MTSNAQSKNDSLNNIIDFLPCKYKNFELLDRMGSGGMAEVFRAVTLDDVRRLVIIKRPHEHLIEDVEFLEMFRDEIKISAKLKHPNIAYVNSYDLNGKYIELEYIKGFTLSEIIKKCKILNIKIPFTIIFEIIIEVAKGLKYLHEFKDDVTQTELNLIHRDISPQNIMISNDGQIKIIDFGVAKIANHINQTQADVIKGKYNYMSPEQCSPSKKLDGRSDLFSLGIVLFELLTLKKIFQSKSLEHYLTELRNFKAVEPKDIDDTIPEEVSRLTYKLIQPEPEFRFQSASELVNSLEIVKNNLNSSKEIVELSVWLKTYFNEEIKMQELSLQESLRRSKVKNHKEDETLIISQGENLINKDFESSKSEPINNRYVSKYFDSKQKKIFFILIFFVLSVIGYLAFNKQQGPPLNQIVLSYEGARGTQVSIAKLEKSNDEYLIYFQNTQSVWNNKSFIHKKIYVNFKDKYVTQFNGEEYATIVGYENKNNYDCFVYLPDLEPEKIIYNKDLSERADLNQIWNNQKESID